MIASNYSLTATERILPRLALDFTTGVLDSRVTVTRALNTATCVNSSGYIELVNANLPRFDYDPITLAPKGLLIEETRVNYALYSNDLTNVVWTATNMTTAKTATGPDNVANSATTITASADNATILQAITDASNTRITSCYIKRRTGTGTVEMTQDNGTTWAAVAVTSSWTRVNIASATLANPTIGLRVVTSGDAIDIYGFQNERGTFATSYIPTTTTSLTRSTDLVSMTGTNFSDWYNASEGTFYAEGSRVNDDTFTALVSVSTDSSNEMYLAEQGGRASGFMRSTGGVNGDLFGQVGSWPVGTVGSAVLAYKENASALAVNANAIVQDTAVTIPTVNKMNIGSRATNTVLINGHVAKVLYWPMRLTNAEVQAFSKG